MSKRSYNELQNLKVVDLRRICQQNEIKGYSKMKKDELCRTISKTVDGNSHLKKRMKHGIDLSNISNKQIESHIAGKVILVVVGCFCPAHAGHYNMVKNAIERTNPDIISITSSNSEKKE